MIILVFLIVAIALGVVLGRLLWKLLPVIVILLAIGWVGSHWSASPQNAASVAYDGDDSSVRHAKAICVGDKDPDGCERAAEFADMLDKMTASAPDTADCTNIRDEFGFMRCAAALNKMGARK